MHTTPPDSRFIIDCAGTPPSFFNKMTYGNSRQLKNLYKGVLNMNEVEGVLSPSQTNGPTRFDVIHHELKDYEFVSAHAVPWYLRPENREAFLKICPSGHLVFYEKYCGVNRRKWVITLHVNDGHVSVSFDYANFTFDAEDRFAVRRKPSA